MRHAGRSSKALYRNPIFSTGVTGVAWVLSATILTLCYSCCPGGPTVSQSSEIGLGPPAAPDLAGCTRLDVRYVRGALDHFIPDTAMQNCILNEQEREYVRSFDTWTVTDRRLIEAFARSVAQGLYRHNARGTATSGGVHVACYRDSKRSASFTVYSRSIITHEYNEFAYPAGAPDLTIVDPPGVKPLQVRFRCALNLSKLRVVGLKRGRQRLPYPGADQWGDAIVEELRGRHTTYTNLGGMKKRAYPDPVIAKMFTCPKIDGVADVNDAQVHSTDARLSNRTVAAWRSDYAMNPDCARDSPSDTVFLFEAPPGWNRHGGPELFTFDNHDPKGGLVLLNDGTVKFIRTEEELKQLRWK